MKLKLTGAYDSNTQVLFIKTMLNKTARMCYDSWGYNENTLAFDILLAQMLDYFVP